MDDADLEQIRAARLQQLKAESGGGGTSGQPSSSPDSQDSTSAARTSILQQILEPASQDRLNRIRLVKASRATDVEDRLMMMAQRGLLRAKVTEEQLKDLLGQLAEKEETDGSGVGKIVVRRRKGGWEGEDDDEELFEGLGK